MLDHGKDPKFNDGPGVILHSQFVPVVRQAPTFYADHAAGECQTNISMQSLEEVIPQGIAYISLTFMPQPCYK